jgi:hypothetical protein
MLALAPARTSAAARTRADRAHRSRTLPAFRITSYRTSVRISASNSRVIRTVPYVQIILMNAEKSRLSGLLASHPLEVHAGRNQLQPLLVAVTDREALHAWRLNAPCCAAPHTVRTRRRSLLHLQVREFSGEASIVAVLCSKLFNLPLTLFPVQFGFPWCKSHNSGMHSGQGRKLSVMELKPTDLILRTRVDESVDTIRTSKTQYLPMAAWRGRAGAVR